MSYVCKLFNLLMLNVIQLLSVGMITVYPNFEAPGSFHGLYIKDVVNISDTNTTSENIL